MKNYDKILEELNGKIWDYSELKFNEYKSSNDMIEILKNENFIIKKGLAGMDTAFTATFGSGKPVIGILGEFDALSGLSQKPGEDKPVPREETKNGHGCGHCLLGTAGIGAVLMVRDFLVENNREGTIVFIGCPGEEGGSGKAYLAREGVFDNLDIALTWHPAGGNAVITGSFQANCQVYFKFKGVSSHAAGSPHLGRSALDAVELMNVGVNYLREHIEPTDRIHYAVLDTGGTSPNVVQSHAKVLYLIRSTDTEKVKKLYERVCKVAKGAALMTETEVEIVFDKACSNVISNSILEDVLYETMKEISLPDYDEKDLEFVEKIKKTITDVDRNSDMSLMFVSNFRRKELANRYKEILMSDFVVEHTHQDINIPGSSDVGDCSHVVPTAQFSGACFVPGTPAHSWQMVSQGKEGIAVKGMLYASKVLAKSVERLIKNPQLIEKAKEEFNKVTEKKAYSCPIPIEVKPDILGNR
ncbi:MAG: M20 family metallopeptidase [Fusobacterium perfoetens]|uniref:M20 family metallopeptidase n=1 Tax=Fusobacterium perfoetens TaxID=852 RepID=UPI0023EF85CF|nr:M20 family metallopeptidase [Fusobacterium perfoetens]MCI6151875.1 M20 family metallopeptidase [Fusobacterium perfoetens]MDY3236764.1 M20 family metallopeptidase [Fusobacterium perfoetens]